MARLKAKGVSSEIITCGLKPAEYIIKHKPMSYVETSHL